MVKGCVEEVEEVVAMVEGVVVVEGLVEGVVEGLVVDLAEVVVVGAMAEAGMVVEDGGGIVVGVVEV